jgi:hypothetical protein
MAKHTSVGKTRQSAARERIHDVSVDGWPIGDVALHALDDPDIGVDASSFYRWRRNRSEPPPPLGPTGSGLAHYRRRDRDA